MKPSGMRPADRAARIICCFGISSVSSVGSMPTSVAQVFAADVHADEPAEDAAMAGIRKKAAGVSIIAMKRVCPSGSPRASLELGHELVEKRMCSALATLVMARPFTLSLD